ncbi:MAG: (E)-4-hydroxy-3-methylbut-2-enyl-diphosphate synthase [Ignavibacteria bacterium]|nr:(E)-4-hydroxy-3-methylbut-2-enyl-diphosphate synthase [Ignavibacteria bacterium]
MRKKIIRYKTRVVKIGDVPLGGDYPVRIQSMTTTDTMDTKATVEQSIRIIEAGGEYVRITAPSIKEAENLKNIRDEIRKRGYNTPLIADIHFTPNAAEIAARIVEKVRVNPGNYADKKKFEIKEYSDSQYNEELERIRNKFSPLVKICKDYGTAMRIGTNHGSLSDRIMSRYGDTPLGMVESALEFVRICEDNNYFEIVLSMKASNPRIMLDAYRLLIDKMEEAGMNYPLHLGVTEAGDGEDGRIKSALGIGVLLEEGIGDTIRVSLTEEPEFEIPVCRILTERYEYIDNENFINDAEFPPPTPSKGGYNHHRIKIISSGIPVLSKTVDKAGGKNPPAVIISFTGNSADNFESLRQVGYLYSETLDKWTIGDAAPEYIYLKDKDIDYHLPGTLKKIFDYDFWSDVRDKDASIPLIEYEQLKEINVFSDICNFILVKAEKLNDDLPDLKNVTSAVLILELNSYDILKSNIEILQKIRKSGFINPVMLKINYSGINAEELTVFSSIDLGGTLIENLADGLWLDSDGISQKVLNSISFGILQAARRRISKTEYISCPSCGRTLFDLQETTAMIRNATNHLKGVKIAIMGCIVNGPGEMADADYGYVGSGPGKITLYKGKEVMKRSIDTKDALTELINLIKEHGDWVEK